MSKMLTIALVFILLIFATSSIFATVIHIPLEQPTIQAGVDAALEGDTVLVADGTYTGDGNRDIDFGGKNLVLMSENGPELTIIDCEGSEITPYRGFYFHSGEDSTAVLDGFTIQNGYAPFDSTLGSYFGGGILCVSGSSPTLTNCILSNNNAVIGGGMYCYESSSKFVSCTFLINSANVSGGAISLAIGNPVLIDCVFKDNQVKVHGNGGALSYAGGPTGGRIELIRCYFESNQIICCTGSGGAISGGGNLILTDCTDRVARVSLRMTMLMQAKIFFTTL